MEKKPPHEKLLIMIFYSLQSPSILAKYLLDGSYLPESA